jgi:adenine-specific DNA-methyltransferase
MQNLLNDLKELLKEDERLISGDDLLKNKIIELALKLDEDLIKLIYSHDRFREYFFKDIDGIVVFDKDKFIRFVNNKEFLPDSYTSFKNKIGLTVDDEYLSKSKEVVLSWPYKDCVLEGEQRKEDEKRDEIFWNETLAPDEIDRLYEPKVFSNFKRLDKDGEYKVKEIKETDNLIIKGNNLLVLHSLKERFAGKVKLIYIDPPYNTGGSKETFTYNNNFNHSTWLTFIKNRLKVAKELLRDDGFIAITIDHNELLYLGVIADEIFGRDNRVGIITIVHKPEGRQNDKYFTATNEFMLVYAISSNSEFNNIAIDEDIKDMFNMEDEKGSYKLKEFLNNDMMERVAREVKPKNWYPIYVSSNLKSISLTKKKGYKPIFPITDSGKEKTWITIPETTKERINNEELVAKKDKNRKIKIYYKFREQQRFKTHWVDKKYNATAYGTNLLKNIIKDNSFSYPKSLYSVLDTLKIMTSDDDIILDFFAGSGTTGHAILELNKEDGGNRRFILVEQLEEHIEVCHKRIKKVIENIENENNKKSSYNEGNNFVSFEMNELNERFIKHINKIEGSKGLLKLWNEIKRNAFLSYRVDIKEFEDNIEDFKNLSIENQKRFLLEVLDKNQLYLNYSEIEDEEYDVSEEDKKLNRKFYGD